VTENVNRTTYRFDYGRHILCLPQDVVHLGVIGARTPAATVHRMHREVLFELRRDARPAGVIRRGPVDEQ
jgi:hypothetical protein